MPHQTERQLAADEIQDRLFAGVIAELTVQLDDLLCYLITHATRTVLFFIHRRSSLRIKVLLHFRVDGSGLA
jgi:hypothetical protein